jgi:hypothetical protein
MNEKQRKVLVVIAVAVLAMLIYPPYVQYLGGETDTVSSSSYAFIFDLPIFSTIHAPTLLIQWLGVLVVGGIVFLVVKD